MLTSLAKFILVKLRYPNLFTRSHLIGAGVEFGEGCRILRDVEINSGVAIGEYTYVNVGTIIGSGSIGKFCSIGYRCQIGLPEHPTDFLSTSSRTYSDGNILGVPAYWNDYPAPPIIENDVWIGSGAIVAQGVRIGDGAVIGAGAVVTKDVAPYAIVVGVPARELRKRFDDATIERLLAMKWWDRSIDGIRDLKSSFIKGAAWWDEGLDRRAP